MLKNKVFLAGRLLLSWLTHPEILACSYSNLSLYPSFKKHDEKGLKFSLKTQEISAMIGLISCANSRLSSPYTRFHASSHTFYSAAQLRSRCSSADQGGRSRVDEYAHPCARTCRPARRDGCTCTWARARTLREVQRLSQRRASPAVAFFVFFCFLRRQNFSAQGPY